MTQTIEQLTAKVAEMEAENARLKAECDDIKQVQFPRKLEAVAVGWKKRLAAKVAELEKDLLKTKLDLLTSYGESEELLGRIAELKEENARLNSSPTIEACRQMIRDKAVIEASTLHEQLAAEQFNNKRLRDALQAYIDEHEECQDADDWMAMMCSMEAHHAADEAISQPSDTSALDSFVAEKVKESHKVIPREGLVPHAYQLEATHNNAEYWYKWGHSKEAAEKGESVICMAQAVFAWRNAAYAKAEEVESLTRQRDLAVEALKWLKLIFTDSEMSQERNPELWMPTVEEAIKESEAK